MTLVFELELALLVLVSLAMISIVWSTLALGISPMPTTRPVLDALLTMVSPEQTGEVHELGAGWGTVAFALARRCPSAQIIAHEASPVPFFFLWCRLRVSGVRNVTLRFGNFLRADLSGAAGVVAYLWTRGMEQLAPKFDAELKPGAFVLSHTFAWRGRSAHDTKTATDLYRTPIYRYLIDRPDHLPPP